MYSNKNGGSTCGPVPTTECPVDCQYDLNNTLISTFISFNDASRQTGVPSSTIKKCVKDNKTNRGFIWKKE